MSLSPVTETRFWGLSREIISHPKLYILAEDPAGSAGTEAHGAYAGFFPGRLCTFTQRGTIHTGSSGCSCFSHTLSGFLPCTLSFKLNVVGWSPQHPGVCTSCVNVLEMSGSAVVSSLLCWISDHRGEQEGEETERMCPWRNKSEAPSCWH